MLILIVFGEGVDAPLSLAMAIGLIYPLGSAFPVHRVPPQRASVHS